MGCAPPTVPTAGKEARLGWTLMEKQAVRAPTPVCPRTCSHQGTASCPGQGVEMAHHGEDRAPGRGQDLSPTIPRARPTLCSLVLGFPTPCERQMEGLSPIQVPWVQEGMSRTLLGCLCKAGGGCRGSPPCTGVSSGSAQPWLAAQHHPAPRRSPTLTSCGAGGRLQRVWWEGKPSEMQQSGLRDPGRALG